MRIRTGLTIIEMLVVIGVIAVALTLIFPAIQLTRESARRVGCANHLRQIGLGLENYHTASSHYPIGCVEWRSILHPENRQLAWSAFLLPYIEQQILFDGIDFDSAFDSLENSIVASSKISVYRCPASLRTRRPFEQALSDYGGIYGERISSPNSPPKGVMLIDKAVSKKEIDDGLSHTAIVAEDARSTEGQWINGNNIFDQAFPINGGPDFENDIRSQHVGGANVCFCDASVRFFSNSTELHLLASICTRSGNEINEY